MNVRPMDLTNAFTLLHQHSLLKKKTLIVELCINGESNPVPRCQLLS
jgi:hypothetical protein